MATYILRDDRPILSPSARTIIARIVKGNRRVMLYGPPGVGKSTLAAEMASELATADRGCWCIGADPGSPAFGVPGAISLGQWQDDAWRVLDSIALCTLDAGRFRLPLVSAVRQLAQHPLEGVVLIDCPGVVRGVAGRELLAGLVNAANVDVVLALVSAEMSADLSADGSREISAKKPPLPLDELDTVTVDIYMVHAAAEAVHKSKRLRARRRTAQWDTYLTNAVTQQFDLAGIKLIGTPPPLEAASVWAHRQVALLQAGQTLALGEVQHLDAQWLTVRVPHAVTGADSLLVRDVQRNPEGLVRTAPKIAAQLTNTIPAAEEAVSSWKQRGGPPIVVRVGAVNLCLVNGVFGDPLLHVQLLHQRRSLLFDLGEGGSLPARIAHQVTDVFITHAHLDHIGGFIWLLRSRMGEFPTCRLYGPAGLSLHIEGFLQGILWDRINERGPSFEVTEFHSDRVQRFYLQAGHQGRRLLDEKMETDGILLDETGFRVRAIELDHRGTPVLAYAFEQDKQISIRKERLLAHGLAPGPWLAELKRSLLSGQTANLIQLPDGSKIPAASLGEELAFIRPGKKLIYATDLADTEGNRQRLVRLAQSAHTFFCETTFSAADAEHAARHGHLTTLACGEIAAAAGVEQLFPFHFSRRYTHNPRQMYEEIETVCRSVVVPRSMAFIEASNQNGIGSQS